MLDREGLHHSLPPIAPGVIDKIKMDELGRALIVFECWNVFFYMPIPFSVYIFESLGQG